MRSVQLFFHVLSKGNITGEAVIGFLSQLRRQLRGPIILVWDFLQAHRCKQVQEYLQRTRRITACHLPPYAPELNPVEYAWCYLKMNPLANQRSAAGCPGSAEARVSPKQVAIETEETLEILHRPEPAFSWL